MSAPMVRAILDGRKTQTRRIVKCGIVKHDDESVVTDLPCPYGQPGDGLWVKETFYANEERQVSYRADEEMPKSARSLGCVWKPSIFMPRWASRITLEITGVRVERLQDISEEDAKAEGAERGCWCNDGVFCEPMDEVDEKMASYRSGYGFIWESINGKGSWDVNPWVWCISFKRL